MRIFGKTKPSDVFNMPNNPSEFIAQLSRRKFWCCINPQILLNIAQNANGDIELLRNFVFVSEQHCLVSNNFVKLAHDSEPLSGFALTLYFLGSSLCRQHLSVGYSEQQKFNLLGADLAFTSAILCNPFQLEAYLGMAFLYGEININKPVALEWCQKYKDAEDALLATPDEKLTVLQKSRKNMIQEPARSQRVMQEMEEVLFATDDEKLAPVAQSLKHHRAEEGDQSEDRPMRELIEDLEQRLIRTQ